MQHDMPTPRHLFQAINETETAIQQKGRVTTMKSKLLTHSLTALTVSSVLMCASAQPGGGDAASGKKPNILFIMGDDIGWMQPSCYHQGLMVGETPNIDRIA